jgi:type II secretory pathway pseudopilin PulG
MSRRPVGAWFLAVAGVAVTGALVAALAVIGSPTQQRAQRFDERRVRELAQLKEAIDEYAESEKRLPASLDVLRRDGGRADLPRVDPNSGAAYGYRVLDTRRYELCAVFETTYRAEDSASSPTADAWYHPSGRHCFIRVRPVENAQAPWRSRPAG